MFLCIFVTFCEQLFTIYSFKQILNKYHVWRCKKSFILKIPQTIASRNCLLYRGNVFSFARIWNVKIKQLMTLERCSDLHIQKRNTIQYNQDSYFEYNPLVWLIFPQTRLLLFYQKIQQSVLTFYRRVLLHLLQVKKKFKMVFRAYNHLYLFLLKIV